MNNICEKTEYYRKKIIQTAWKGKGGHITSSLSIADILAVLYWGDILKHDAKNPEDVNRDRLILSKAHAGLGLYTILALEGYFPVEWLDNYCQPGQLLGDHASSRVPGVEHSGGSLGHGLSVAAGIALSAKVKNQDYLTYVITGDGECQEGSIWEAALFIGNHHLNNLVWIIDYNRLQANSRVENVNGLEPLTDKLNAFGFEVKVINGHNHKEIYEALKVDKNELPNKPIAVIANTIKGYGVDLFAGKEGWHGRTPNPTEYQTIIESLGLTMEEFEAL